MPGVKLVAFDCFGTLVENERDEWIATLSEIAAEQDLPVPGVVFYEAWSKLEVNFRKIRTNMSDPSKSPPFMSYWEAWSTAFRDTFAVLEITGDADAAATKCVDDMCKRKAFPEVSQAIGELDGRIALGVMSNADDRFLFGALKQNGWTFDPVISSEAARAYKPDPRAFEAICTAVGVLPAEVLYVGDSPYDDAHGAKLVGMSTVLIARDQSTPGRTPPPNTAKLLAPDFVVTKMTESSGILDSLA